MIGADRGAGAEIWVLMALYRGERYLQVQLDSLAAQSHRRWRLIVSDDTPADRAAPGRAILARFAAAHPDHRVEVVPGPGQGPCANFLSLLRRLPEQGAWAAWADQDDRWYPDKLARAVAALAAAAGGGPALYAAARRVCGPDLTPRQAAGHARPLRRPPDFANALVQSLAGGHTMLLDPAGAALARAAAEEVAAAGAEPVIHDWWLYQLITGAGGRVIHDPAPVLDYRQHEQNQIGAEPGLAGRWDRLRPLLAGRYRGWNRRNLAALAASAHRLTPAARSRLAAYGRAAAPDSGPRTRLRALAESGARRQGRLGTAALWIACLLGRL